MARVMITGTEGWAIDQIDHALRSAGHTVMHCHVPGEPTFPCVGLQGGRCPLDGDAEVVLTVRARPLPQPVRREGVVTCGLRAGLPLVVAGSTVLNPFANHASEVVEGLDHGAIVAAVECVARPDSGSAGLRAV